MWSPTSIHIKLLSVFIPLFLHLFLSKIFFPHAGCRLAGFRSLSSYLRLFCLHCLVGGPFHHYLLPADDRMIGFLLGFSMVLFAKCYWKYSSKFFLFFQNLLILLL